MENIIALIDCDAFFVSCEQAAKPELKGQPVCVIGGGERGCVLSRSKEAKAMGVRMGMPYFMAKKEFPKAVYINASHGLYGEYSQKVMAVLREFSPKVEVYSIDEAFVDLTGLERLYKKNSIELARHIRDEIKTRTDIPVSIGISTSKSLAKLASDKAKKLGEGVFCLSRTNTEEVLKKTDINEIWGIGRNLTKMFHRHGILTAHELISKPDAWIDSKTGIRGLEMKHELLGQMVSPVSTDFKMPKSIQKTSALPDFTSDINIIKSELNYHIHRACVRLRRLDAKCSSVGVMLRTKDFKIFYDKKVLLEPTDFELEISEIAFNLLDKIFDPTLTYRSSGVILDKFVQNESEQLSLLTDPSATKKSKLGKAIDKLENKFGRDIVRTGF